jgi:predicted nucleic acid-binding protein
MRVVVDSNVLLCSIHPNNPQHSDANRALESLRKRNEELILVSQVACEWWAVATRPLENNGLGLSTSFASRVFSVIQSSFKFIPDPPSTLDKWLELVTKMNAKGKSAHDARLAAVALLIQADAILTFNVDDFRRYPSLVVLDPVQVT